ncbi:MAG: DUF559 domain-containing protein [Thermomonas sp.]
MLRMTPSLAPQAEGRAGEGLSLDRLRLRARELRNASTDAERLLWRALRCRQLQGFRFRRQVPISGYVADFVCPEARLIIELDGGQHSERIEYDSKRSEILLAAGYNVVRYWNHDVMAHTVDVVADIQRKLEETSTPSQPPPSAARKGEG